MELPKYSRMVSHAEIERNEFNLNIPRYIDSQEAEDVQDIEAHLLGGIPNRDVDELENYWRVFPKLKGELFSASDREKYSRLNVGQSAIKDTIYTHPEFVGYSDTVRAIFQSWRERHTPVLNGLGSDTQPKVLIADISEDLLKAFAGDRLIDKYDVYQQLMSYWTETMQDDVYMIKLDGWQANSDLIPRELIVNRYFASEQAQVEKLEAEKENITREREELEEEHGGEEGLFENAKAKNENDKLNRVGALLRIKEIQRDEMLSGDDEDVRAEMDALEKYLALVEREAKAGKKVRDARAELDRKVSEKYDELDEGEVKTLVVEDKWMTTLDAAVRAELDRIAQNLTGRIKTLAERYETPLPQLDAGAKDLTAKVAAHLEKMGFSSRELALTGKFEV